MIAVATSEDPEAALTLGEPNISLSINSSTFLSAEAVSANFSSNLLLIIGLI